MDMRVFGGIFLPNDFWAKITEAQRQIDPDDKLAARGLRWIPPENWHVTVLPPINLPREQLDELFAAVASVTKHFSEFALVFDQLVWGPPNKKPDMIWLQGGPNRQLQNLSDLLDRQTESLGTHPAHEKHKIIPHITLARTSDTFDLRAAASLPAIEPILLSVNKIQVVRSELESDGSHYTVLKELPLERTFEILPHTADFRIRAYGHSAEDLFLHAMQGMSSVLKGDMDFLTPVTGAVTGLNDTSSVSSARDVSVKVDLQAPDRETLLIDFLSKILAESQVQHAVFSELDVERLTDQHIVAKVRGQKVVQFDRDIKAVTYHAVAITQTNSHMEVTVVFDI